MPIIPTYDDHISAQGGIGTRASGNDFGAQVGQGLQQLGQGVGALADTGFKLAETKETTQAHIDMAQAQEQWFKYQKEQANSAAPGDDSFHDRMQMEMKAFFDKGAQNYSTRAGQDTYRKLAASTLNEFGQMATAIQGNLDAKEAKTQNAQLGLSLSNLIKEGMSFDAAVAKMEATINAPGTIFARVSQAVRNELKQEHLENLVKVANSVAVEHDPLGYLKSFAPDKLDLFKPDAYKSLVQSNAAPGAKVSVGQATMQYAGKVAAAGATKGVNTNILLAQLDTESSGNPNAVGAKGEIGLTQFMPATAKQYGVKAGDVDSQINGQATYMADLLSKYKGDYAKALAAYNWGDGNMDAAIRKWGEDWRNHIPSVVNSYVQNIFTKSGMMAGPVVNNDESEVMAAAQPQLVTPEPQREPAASTLPFVKGLTWEQQQHFVNRAVQLAHLKMTMDRENRRERDYELGKARDQISDKFTNLILTGQFTNEHLMEVANNPTLTSEQKQHLATWSMSYKHQVQQMQELKSHPATVRELFGRIHAGDTDPQKIWNMDAIMEQFNLGGLSVNEVQMLRKEVADLRDGSTSGFTREVQMARSSAHAMLTHSVYGQAQPEVAEEAAYRFSRDMEAKIEQYRKDGKDPRVFLDPKSREYLLSKERVMGFMGLPGQGGAQVQSPYKVGQIVTDADGVSKKYKGGDPTLTTSWESVTKAEAAASAAPAPQVTPKFTTAFGEDIYAGNAGYQSWEPKFNMPKGSPEGMQKQKERREDRR